jgi:hypothetical protein
VVAARRITAGQDAAKEIDDLDLLDGSVRSCPHTVRGRGPCFGTGIPSATVTGHFGHAPEDAAGNMNILSCTTVDRSPHTTKTPSSFQKRYISPLQCDGFRYHSHLAAHCIALSRILQNEERVCEEKKSRQRLLLDAQGASIFIIGSSRRDGLVM